LKYVTEIIMNKNNNKIIRTPILLNKNTVALIHVFHRHDHLEDIWIFDVDKYQEEITEAHEKAAKQFVEHWTRRFMEALRNEIQQQLDSEQSTIIEAIIKNNIQDLPNVTGIEIEEHNYFAIKIDMEEENSETKNKIFDVELDLMKKFPEKLFDFLIYEAGEIKRNTEK